MGKGGWLVVLVAACVHSGSIDCPDGRTCPSGNVCDNVNHGCVLPEQLQTCAGLPDDMTCSIEGSPVGVCRNSVCLRPICGDGFIDGSERCDSQNLGVATTCAQLGYYTSEPLACTADCVYDTSACTGGRCGDHIINGPEFCEDGIAPPDSTCLDFGYDRGLIGCTAACTPGFSTCERFGFYPVTTGASQRLQAVWGSGPTDIYAVGAGAILHYDGDAWTVTTGPSTWNGVFGTAANDVWAVGGGGSIAHFDGTSWTNTMLPSGNDLEAVWARTPSDVYAVGKTSGSGGTIAHWDGSAWTEMATAQHMYSVFGNAANVVYAGGVNGAYMLWNGSSWTTPVTIGGSDTLRGLWGTGPDDVYAGTDNSFLHITTTGFTAFAPPVPVSHGGAVWGAGGHVYFGSDQGVADYDGTSLVYFHTDTALRALWGTASDIYGVTASGSLRRFGGTGWIDDHPPAVQQLVAMAGAGSTWVIAGASDATGFGARFWDGTTWQVGNSTKFPALTSITGLSVPVTDTVFAATSTGFIKKFTGSTNFWTQIGSQSGSAWRAVWAVDANEAYVVGDSAKTYQVVGTTTTPINTGATGDLVAVWGTSANDVYSLLSTGSPVPMTGLLLHYSGSGGLWTTVSSLPATPQLHALWGSGPSDVWLVGDGGYIAHGDGTTWKAEDARAFEALLAVGGTSASDVFVGGAAGVLYHFDGTSWAPMRSTTTAAIRAIYATPTEVFLAADDGTHVLMRP